MGKSLIKFLATTQEIMGFIEKLRIENRIVVAGAKYDVPNKYRIMEEAESIEDSGCQFFFIKLGKEYDSTNALFICLGNSDSESLRESVISIKGDGEEFIFWKNIISIFKKTLLRGAYVVNPHRNSKTYYKNVYYTVGAKIAYDNGMKMQPVVGWNYYLLEQE